MHLQNDAGRYAVIDTPTVQANTPPSEGLGEAVVRYQYSNHLSTASLELDEAGSVISYEEYYPYGSTSFQSGRSAAEVSLKRYRYTGKERDEESGLYYHGARYYIPWLCRWTAVDPLEAKFAPQSPYVYCSNNPANKIDPDGRSDGWVDKQDGAGTYTYNSNVNSQGAVVAVYGLNAEYVGSEKDTYGSHDGHTYELFPDGSFLKDGNTKIANNDASILDFYRIQYFGLFSGASSRFLDLINFGFSDQETQAKIVISSVYAQGAMMGDKRSSDQFYKINGMDISNPCGGIGNLSESYGFGKSSLLQNRYRQEYAQSLKSWDLYQVNHFAGGLAVDLAITHGIGEMFPAAGANKSLINERPRWIIENNMPKYDLTKEIVQPEIIIGLGLDEDLVLHRGSGAITYKNGGWQNAGLTKVDWGKASIDDYYFKQSFKEVSENATLIRFHVSNFDPGFSKPKMTNYEFNQILSNQNLFNKTLFIQNGIPVKWNGVTFIK